jgi:hypothetical protein
MPYFSNVKEKQFLCLNKHHAIKADGGGERR